MCLADARCICLFRIVAHQRHQVGFIDEVQKIDVLGITAAVDHNIKGVAALALDRDKLLVLQAILHADGGGRLQNIVNAGQIAVRRQRWDAGRAAVCREIDIFSGYGNALNRIGRRIVAVFVRGVVSGCKGGNGKGGHAEHNRQCAGKQPAVTLLHIQIPPFL